jgi:hypothetical protein
MLSGCMRVHPGSGDLQPVSDFPGGQQVLSDRLACSFDTLRIRLVFGTHFVVSALLLTGPQAPLDDLCHHKGLELSDESGKDKNRRDLAVKTH